MINALGVKNFLKKFSCREAALEFFFSLCLSVRPCFHNRVEIGGSVGGILPSVLKPYLLENVDRDLTWKVFVFTWPRLCPSVMWMNKGNNGAGSPIHRVC